MPRKKRERIVTRDLLKCTQSALCVPASHAMNYVFVRRHVAKKTIFPSVHRIRPTNEIPHHVLTNSHVASPTPLSSAPTEDARPYEAEAEDEQDKQSPCSLKLSLWSLMTRAQVPAQHGIVETTHTPAEAEKERQ